MISRLTFCALPGAVLIVVATSLGAQTPKQPIRYTGQRADSTIRVDPILVIDGSRVTKETLAAMNGDTLELEIIRGRAAGNYGTDADGVMRFTKVIKANKNPSAQGYRGMRGRGGIPGMGGVGGSEDSRGSNPSGGYGSGMGGAGGGMGSPTGPGGDMGSGTPSVASSNPTTMASAGGTPFSVYPIVIYKGSRITVDSLYKLKPKMGVFVQVQDSATATAIYGSAASAGAVILTTVQLPEPPAPAKSAPAKPKKKAATKPS